MTATRPPHPMDVPASLFRLASATARVILAESAQTPEAESAKAEWVEQYARLAKAKENGAKVMTTPKPRPPFFDRLKAGLWELILAELPPVTPTSQYTVEEAVKEIRTALKARSGKQWSVRKGRGSVYGWVYISAKAIGSMTPEECKELASLMGLDRVHQQGINVPASSAHRREYIERARGLTPTKIAEAYWD